MGMTIDNADKLLSVITATITEDDDCFTIEDENLQVFKETLLTAIDTMRKYEKIVEIVKEWREVGLDYDSCDAMDNIERVIEDGNEH